MLNKILAAAAVLALSACGGGGGDSSSSGSSPSGGLSSADYSSRVVSAEIRRRDSGAAMGVSGLPLDGAPLTLSDD